jgi:hypothetical protein
VVVRIDLCDPGPEGPALAAGLRAAGYEVIFRSVAEVPQTSANALLLAGDAEGALTALRTLRDDGRAPDTPVILLGTPPGADHRGEGQPGFGAEAVFLRPVSLPRLLETLARMLGGSGAPCSEASSPREHTVGLGAHGESEGPGRSDVRPERTVQLSEAGFKLPHHVVDAGSRAPSSRPPPTTPVQAPPSGPLSSVIESSAASSSGPVRRPIAAISERLSKLLADADRRVFPGHPPIDLSLPGSDEPAAVLVPNDILEPDDPSIDEIPDEDPIDAITYFGGPVMPSLVGMSELPESRGIAEQPSKHDEAIPHETSPGTPSSGGRRAANRSPGPPVATGGDLRSEVFESPRPRSQPFGDEVSPEEVPLEYGARNDEKVTSQSTGVQAARLRPPSTAPPATTARAQWPEEDSVLGRSTPDGGRRGVLGAGGALRLLFRIAELRLDARVSITPADGEPVTVVFSEGEVLAIEGPIASRAAELLRRRGARLGPADDEGAAVRALEHAVRSGAISPYARDRALREARERLIAEVVAWPKASFSVVRLDHAERPERGLSLFGAPLRAVLLEASRALDPGLARSILGVPAVIRLGPRFGELAETGSIPPELALLLQRCEGAPLDRLIEEAPDEPGLLGLLCGLAAADAIRVHPLPAPEPSATDRARYARRLIEDASRLATEGDYFTILGVAPDAGDRDIERTFALRSAQFAALPLDELGLSELESERRLILAALEEAHRVLRVVRWREAYRAALSAASHLAAPAQEH